MSDCIFCKIIKGEIPSYTIYEDEIVKVFLDVNPVANGHMLIIPKKHYENVFDIDPSIISHSTNLIREKLYPMIKEKLNCDGLTIAQNNGFGQEVKHYHIHLIPRFENDNGKMSFDKDMLKPIDEVYSKFEKK